MTQHDEPGANGRSRWPRWLRFGGRRPGEDRAAQSYRRLAMQLRFEFGESTSGRCILMTTPTPSEHCGRALLELAHLLAHEQRQRVLVIDGRLGRSKGLTDQLQCDGMAGLADALEAGDQGDFDPVSLVVTTAVADLGFLPKGAAGGAPLGLLSAERLGRLLDRLRTAYDYVLVHGPAVLEDPVALAYPSQVDGVLLLVVENESLLADLDASQRALAECKARRVGLVLSAPRRRWSQR